MLCVAIAAAFLAWVFGTPLGSGPDEPSHYIKAMGAGEGQIRGTHQGFEAQVAASGVFDAAQLLQVRPTYRNFVLPDRLAVPYTAGCTAFQPSVNGNCSPAPPPPPPPPAGTKPATAPKAGWSIVGAYPPAVYIVEGIVGARMPDASDAWYSARVIGSLTGAALICLGTMLLLGGSGATARRRLWAATGLAVATSPMVLFIASSAGGSGPELTGAVATGALSLRLSRGEDLRRRDWVAAGFCLLVFSVSRPLALLWIPYYAVLAIILGGPRRVLGVVTRGRLWSLLALGAGLVGYVSTALWIIIEPLSTPIDLSTFGHSFHQALNDLDLTAREAIGVFGWQDTFMTNSFYQSWMILIILLVFGGLVLGGKRAIVLALACVGSLTVTLGLATLIFEPHDFGMQGRYVLPIAVSVPLVACELLGRRGRLAVLDRLPVVVITFVIALQAAAWLMTAHRYSSGVDTGNLVHRVGGALQALTTAGGWNPPLGWTTWLVVVALAAATVLSLARRLSSQT